MRGGQIHLVINFKYRAVLTPTFETSISESNFFGTTQPIKKVTKNPPKISNKLHTESNVSRVFVSTADGIPNIKIKIATSQTDLFLSNLNLSIKDDTGTSNNETEEVIAAI